MGLGQEALLLAGKKYLITEGKREESLLQSKL